MLNILKDPKRISHIFSTVWILIFDKRKGIYIFSTIWIPIFDKGKDWCHLIIFFYFIMSVSVTCYSIFVDVALIIKT